MFTLVWDLENPESAEGVRWLLAPYADAGLRVSVVELFADLDTRLARNHSEQRLAAKPSKRDREWSDANVRELERHRMNTDPSDPQPGDEVIGDFPHLRLDNTDLTPEEAADEILGWLAPAELIRAPPCAPYAGSTGVRAVISGEPPEERDPRSGRSPLDPDG